MKNVRKAFFSFGSVGTFQAELDPLSRKSIFETYFIPIYKYYYGGIGLRYSGVISE